MRMRQSPMTIRLAWIQYKLSIVKYANNLQASSKKAKILSQSSLGTQQRINRLHKINIMAPYSIPALVLIIAAATSWDVASARYLVGSRASSSDESAPTNANVVVNDEPPSSSSEPASLIAAQFTADPHAGRDRLEMIQTGELGLVGIRYMPSSFAEDGDGYSNVYGEFCVYDSQLNKSNPPLYPTLKDVLSTSDHCGEHRYTIPMSEVMKAVRSHVHSREALRTLPLSGMLFHQGYSGAGLISNALAAFESTLVVSEHSALRDALSACDVLHNRHKIEDCSPSKQSRLVRDIITLISRTSDKNVQHLFLKLDSASAVYLNMLRELHPGAKWTFSHRDAEETLSKTMQRKRNVLCGKAKRNPSTALAEQSSDYNLELEGLSHHEVCALHLSTLLEAAVNEHESSGTGMLVSYKDIVSSSSSSEGNHVIIDEVLPYLGLQDEMNSNPSIVTKISEILSTRSNARSKRQGNVAWDSSQEEDIEISGDVRNAVKVFMGGLMGQ